MITLHPYDLSEQAFAQLSESSWLSVDTEATGLNPFRDRLCVVQIFAGEENGGVHLVHFPTADFSKSARLKKLMDSLQSVKIFHYARFDLMMLKKDLDVDIKNIYCTKLASRLSRTSAARHGLKDLCIDLLGIELSKQEQTSDWAKKELSESQQTYAASDVLYLHQLKERLDTLLKREGRETLAHQCFETLPLLVDLDLKNWDWADLFSH